MTEIRPCIWRFIRIVSFAGISEFQATALGGTMTHSNPRHLSRLKYEDDGFLRCFWIQELERIWGIWVLSADFGNIALCGWHILTTPISPPTHRFSCDTVQLPSAHERHRHLFPLGTSCE